MSAYWIIGISSIVTTIVLAILGIIINFVYEYGQWKGSVDADRKKFEEFMVEMRKDVKKILFHVSSTTRLV